MDYFAVTFLREERVEALTDNATFDLCEPRFAFVAVPRVVHGIMASLASSDHEVADRVHVSRGGTSLSPEILLAVPTPSVVTCFGLTNERAIRYVRRRL